MIFLQAAIAYLGKAERIGEAALEFAAKLAMGAEDEDTERNRHAKTSASARRAP